MTCFDYATVAFTTTTFWSNGVLDHQAFNATLNRYGAEGWDLVNVFDVNREGGVSREVVAVFKRAK